MVQLSVAVSPNKSKFRLPLVVDIPDEDFSGVYRSSVIPGPKQRQIIPSNLISVDEETVKTCCSRVRCVALVALASFFLLSPVGLLAYAYYNAPHAVHVPHRPLHAPEISVLGGDTPRVFVDVNQTNDNSLDILRLNFMIKNKHGLIATHIKAHIRIEDGHSRYIVDRQGEPMTLNFRDFETSAIHFPVGLPMRQIIKSFAAQLSSPSPMTSFHKYITTHNVLVYVDYVLIMTPNATATAVAGVPEEPVVFAFKRIYKPFCPDIVIALR